MKREDIVLVGAGLVATGLITFLAWLLPALFGYVQSPLLALVSLFIGQVGLTVVLASNRFR
jgi:hypothetical protein